MGDSVFSSSLSFSLIYIIFHSNVLEEISLGSSLLFLESQLW